MKLAAADELIIGKRPEGAIKSPFAKTPIYPAEANGFIDGIGEWIMSRPQIPVKDYQQLATQFNPVKFNAHDFIATAENAGVKRAIPLTQEHDYFGGFHTLISSIKEM